jgi:hypothetical protein
VLKRVREALPASSSSDMPHESVVIESSGFGRDMLP